MPSLEDPAAQPWPTLLPYSCPISGKTGCWKRPFLPSANGALGFRLNATALIPWNCMQLLVEGLTSIWFTAGATLLKAIRSASRSGWKLPTPMARIFPACCSILPWHAMLHGHRHKAGESDTGPRNQVAADSENAFELGFSAFVIGIL